MSSPRLCIITTNKRGYSETFVRNQIDYLPFSKLVLYNGHLPILFDWKTDTAISNVLIYKLKQKLFRSNPLFKEQYITSYLPKFLRKNKIQVVLAEFGPVGAHIQKACQKANVPLIVHFHGDDAHALRYIEKFKCYSNLVNNAEAVVCVSRTMLQALKECGFSDDQLCLIPYGIDTSFFSNANPIHSSPTFVSVGRFVDKKAPHITILAFKEVLKSIPEAQLIFIGTGPLLVACKELAQALCIDDNVKFKGVCTQEEIRQVISSARAFVMHSVTPETGEKEGTPLSILEASASGLAIISTLHAGIPDAVIHEKTGFLVNEYDYKKMAAFMVHLAQNPKLAHQMGIAGRSHIRKNYDLKEQIAKLAKVISNRHCD